jgi:penicillin amidase
MRRIAERYLASLPAAERAELAAYARGVNYYLERHRGRLPLEFTLLGYEPRHWGLLDSLLVLVQMMEIMDRSWPAELRKEAFAREADPAKLTVLYPACLGAENRPASNAWALAGSLTAGGRPLLAGDMHLEFSLPSIWHMVHLRGPGLNVAGFALPGVPGVVAGHNERIAWSMTSLGYDVQDLYIEKLDPLSGVYLYRDHREQAAREREVIRIKGQAPETLLLLVTRHGPVAFSEGGRLLALRWAAAEIEEFRFPLVELNRAHNWPEFRAALSKHTGPGLTFVFADNQGNIGSQVAGRLPIRRNWDGSMPVDGSSGKAEWDGFIPFEQLPSIWNPASGMVVSANECPFPAGYPYPVSGSFAAPYRKRQIEARLSVRSGWKAQQMLSVQTDVYSAPAHFVAQQAVAAFDRGAKGWEDLRAAVELLRKWDGQMRAGEAAPLVATLLYRHLRTGIGNAASPGNGLSYRSTGAAAVVEQLLRTRPAGWFRDYDEFVLTSLRAAIQEGRRMQGDNLSRWDYGKLLTLRLEHPVVGRLPWIGRYFALGPVELAGSPDTVNQVGGEEVFIGPSMRMVVDLGNLDGSLMNLPIGESGQLFSRHYKDQWKAYLAGRSYPAAFTKIEAAETLTVLPERP